MNDKELPWQTRLANARAEKRAKESDQLQADAKLGRMVQKLKVGMGIGLYRSKWIVTGEYLDALGKGDTPLDALLAAGITDD